MWVKGSKEQVLLFGGAVYENSEIVSNFFKILIKEIQFLESNISKIETHNGIHKVEFNLAELLNDIKMVAFLAGELSNDVTYFCTFANLVRNEANDWEKNSAVTLHSKILAYRANELKSRQYKLPLLTNPLVLPKQSYYI